MKSLGDLMNDAPCPKRWERNRYRRNAQFVRDPVALSTPMDRNARARLLYLAELLERRTKAPGRRNGTLGYAGLAVLKALLLRFANGKTGLCCPSYTALQCATGLCRQAIADALSRLERAGLLRIVRRLVRERVTRISPTTGLLETYVGTIQSSSIYSFAKDERAIDWFASHLPASNSRPVPLSRRFPFVRKAESARQGETETFIYSKKRVSRDKNKNLELRTVCR